MPWRGFCPDSGAYGVPSARRRRGGHKLNHAVPLRFDGRTHTLGTTGNAAIRRPGADPAVDRSMTRRSAVRADYRGHTLRTVFGPDVSRPAPVGIAGVSPPPAEGEGGTIRRANCRAECLLLMVGAGEAVSFIWVCIGAGHRSDLISHAAHAWCTRGVHRSPPPAG